MKKYDEVVAIKDGFFELDPAYSWEEPKQFCIEGVSYKVDSWDEHTMVIWNEQGELHTFTISSKDRDDWYGHWFKPLEEETI